MIGKLKKINFKHPKYVLAIIAYGGFLLLSYLFYDIKEELSSDKEEVIETIGKIMTDMPEPAPGKGDLSSKYKSMLENYGKITDYTAIENIAPEELDDNISIGSAYSEDEIAALDSLNQLRQEQNEKLKRIQESLSPSSTDLFPVGSTYENPNLTASEREMDDFRQQIDIIQRIARGEKIKTPEEVEAEEKARAEEEKRERELEEKRLAEAPVEVVKATRPNEAYFNTIGDSYEGGNLIKAMVDEQLKIVDGSRIRIRLMDDVYINDILLEKGTYLYAIVSGFGAQRVRANITSILVGGKHEKVNLKIYDNDGIEGFYVPSSAFRDLSKDIGASALNQSINMNSTSGEQNFETFAFQTLQSIYQSTTQAVSRSIKKNKAKLKYNTTVYLVNEQN